MTPAPALDLTTSLRGDLKSFKRSTKNLSFEVEGDRSGWVDGHVEFEHGDVSDHYAKNGNNPSPFPFGTFLLPIFDVCVQHITNHMYLSYGAWMC